ncbi:hypothetical protein [Nocardiopsis tropica]|uniref:Uncharacterized protein n=1 Tax=Nocardiopsis tropica TaxID=109330 RepID=A0ABU7KVW8_9ACTN|nr:hypothetical protein [Nocardiopsis umidischolae]MEE2053446.1 hypothetical protein [Nocardiopsis umidischolae]
MTRAFERIAKQFTTLSEAEIMGTGIQINAPAGGRPALPLTVE